ncbi:HAD-IA family hydrolase [Anaerobacillus sp. CMMVII]|uniref:HAD-IA family hydrolase n=1 Tax=Anaerobacillus sp. CMMVII TaxID=2755588 RepID=UPI0021B72FD6|nr:HAD-IA family hydrolase [Anaerobacillus sp. CMMVII]MCT8138106.1 HAD-IA family hydrolase [Anaerobacillus sp. CMMVII]
MLKYIIFDFDGTLVDSKDLSIQVINQLAEKYQINKLSETDIEHLRKYSIAERCKAMNFPLYKIPFALIDFLLLYKDGTKQLELFPGIKELLTTLEKEDYKLAVISSNTEENIKQALHNNQVENINEILAASIFGKDKVIKKFLKNHRLKASEVLYVGDELRDILACKRAGIKIAWVSWGFDSIEVTNIEQPDFFAHHPNEIYSIANSIGG